MSEKLENLLEAYKGLKHQISGLNKEVDVLGLKPEKKAITIKVELANFLNHSVTFVQGDGYFEGIKLILEKKLVDDQLLLSHLKAQLDLCEGALMSEKLENETTKSRVVDHLDINSFVSIYCDQLGIASSVANGDS